MVSNFVLYRLSCVKKSYDDYNAFDVCQSTVKDFKINFASVQTTIAQVLLLKFSFYI